MQFCIHITHDTEIQGREVKVHQFGSEPRAVWILKVTQGLSLGLYLQHILKNQPWLLRESAETA